MSEELLYLNILLIILGLLWVTVAFYSTRKGAGEFSFMGVTTPETTKSSKAWMEAHRSIKFPLIIFGSLMLLSGALLLVLSHISGSTSISIGRFALFINVPFVIYCYFRANGVAKKINHL